MSSRHQPERDEMRTVIIGGMQGLRVGRRDLENAFGAVGEVERAIVGPETASLTFYDAKAAREAVRRFDGGQLNERTIEVYFEGDEPTRQSSRRGGRSRTPRVSSRNRDASGRGRDRAERSRSRRGVPSRAAPERRRRSPSQRGGRRR